MISDDLQELARRMGAALETGVAAEPASSQGRSLDLDDAYRVQHAVLESRRGDSRVCGYKVAMRTPALHGEVLSSDVVQEGEVIPVAAMVSPKIEAELGFVIGEPLSGDDLIVTDVLRATEFLLPAFEVVDCRLVGGLDNQPADLIADNSMFAGMVLGGPPARVDAMDVRGIEVTISVDGNVVETGETGRGSVNPTHAVIALAAHLHRHGRQLNPGDVVLTGSCTTPVPVASGNHVTAVFAGFGHVSIAFGD